jgi:pentatricopeptide repeat protein
MIKAHGRERDLKSATRVFNDVRSSGATLTPMIYNCYLDACVQCGDLEGAKKHFQEMKQLNFVDVVGYNTVLKAYLARGCTQEAHDLVKEMTSHGLQANKVTYNELLHAKVLAKDRRGLWSIVDEMRAAGVQANPVTCSILLKSLTAHSYPTDVQRVISLIDDVEEEIDEVLFSSVIEACIRIRQLDVLSDLMRRYRQKGGFVNLTAPTYGSMIKAYGQYGDVARVRELWNEMEERCVKPTSITLGCMTEALVANQQADEAWELLHAQFDTEERRGCVNTVIYSTVVKGFAVARRIDKVFGVYQEMRKRDIPCNTITYNTMLDACAKCCTMDRASGLLVDMKESSVEPDIITYSTIVKGYCLEGDVDRAFNVLEDMKSDDKFAADEIMYNSILDGCAKQHRVDDALKLLEEMQTTGVIPSNYTLSILVKLLGHARRLSQAFKLVEELSQEHGFRPNVQVYTCLVQACLLNRRLERAMSLHDTMIADAGCTTDEKFYAVLARGCLQLHQPLKAVEVVRAAFQLPGHNMATPTRSGRPVGVEARALDEIAARLRSGSKEEQEAHASLSADLLEYRGLHLGDGQGFSAGRGGQYRGRRGGGGKGGGKGYGK